MSGDVAYSDAINAWQDALKRLQAEMSKAAFDTWVKSAELIGWKDNRFEIGVRNAYARDWLENRLGDRLERLLGENMGSPQRVSFVVWHGGGEEVAKSAGEGEVTVEAVQDETLYQHLVRPDKVVILPGYFRRWVGLMGPELAWMYVAFRQAAYAAGERRGERLGHFSGAQIAALCGITERTFWNRAARAETWERLHGLVERVGERTGWRAQEDGTPYQSTNRYRVQMSLPLTPRDAAALAAWLQMQVAEGVSDGELSSRTAGLSLADLDVLQVAPLSAPASVRQVVTTILGNRLSGAMVETLVAVLQERLMPGNDVLMVTHFFIEQVLPRMGAGAAWLYVLLRDRCWEGETPRDVVRIEGGYAEMARWLGLSRPLTVYEWLNTKPSLLWAYMRPLEQERRWSGDGKWDLPRYFQVLLSDVPLEYLRLGNEQELRDYFGQERFVLGVREFEAKSLRDFHSLVTQFSEFGYATFIPELRDFHGLVTQLSYPRLRNFHSLVTRFSELKLLNSGLSSKALVDGLTHPPYNPPFPTEAGAQAERSTGLVGVHFGFEVLDRLGVNPETQKRLADEGVEPWMVISWLLYASDQKTLRDPLAFAVRRALDRRCGAGGRHDRLAQNPVKLAEWLGHQSEVPVGLKGLLGGGA